jgi:outer membrane lipoprotein-sorting protein
MSRVLLFAWVLMLLACEVVPADTLADKLLAEYAGITSVTCQVRKDSEGGGESLRLLSRVYYQKPNRLHVESIHQQLGKSSSGGNSIQRRIVADGSNFYSYVTGDSKGFVRAVEKLDRDMLIGLQKVPGTAMDHLLRLQGIPETNLTGTAEFPVRRGYQAPKVFVILELDGSNRLARIEFYSAADQKECVGTYTYSNFQQVASAWIPCLHQGVLFRGGIEARETSRVLNLEINQPIPAHLFVSGLFFKDVEFASTFDEIYREKKLKK